MSAVFLKVLNMSITAGWMILGAIFVRLLLKKAPKWISCLLWGLVALRLALPFPLKSALSLIPSAEPIPQDIALKAEPAVETGIPVVNGIVNPVISNSFAPDPAAGVNPLQIVIPVASAVWIAGIAAMLIYSLIGFLKLKKTVSVRLPAGEGIYSCDGIGTPFILGVFRPKIFVPSSLKKETLEIVTAHEKAHLKRLDHLWKPLGFLLLSLHWFNPLCWVAYILLCRDIEAACDEKVVRDMDKDGVAAYSRALLDCGLPRGTVAACPLAFGEVGVKGRIKGILNYKKPAFWVILTAVIVCVLLAVFLLTDPFARASEPEVTGERVLTAQFRQYGGNDYTVFVYDSGHLRFARGRLKMDRSGGEVEKTESRATAFEIPPEKYEALIAAAAAREESESEHYYSLAGLSGYTTDSPYIVLETGSKFDLFIYGDADGDADDDSNEVVRNLCGILSECGLPEAEKEYFGKLAEKIPDPAAFSDTILFPEETVLAYVFLDLRSYAGWGGSRRFTFYRDGTLAVETAARRETGDDWLHRIPHPFDDDLEKTFYPVDGEKLNELQKQIAVVREWQDGEGAETRTYHGFKNYLDAIDSPLASVFAKDCAVEMCITFPRSSPEVFIAMMTILEICEDIPEENDAGYERWYSKFSEIDRREWDLYNIAG